MPANTNLTVKQYNFKEINMKLYNWIQKNVLVLPTYCIQNLLASSAVNTTCIGELDIAIISGPTNVRGTTPGYS